MLSCHFYAVASDAIHPICDANFMLVGESPSTELVGDPGAPEIMTHNFMVINRKTWKNGFLDHIA